MALEKVNKQTGETSLIVGNNGFYSSPVSCLVGDTTCTITDANILATSIIEDYSETSSGNKIVVPQIDVTAGQAVLHFDALEEAATFIIHIINL